MSTVAFVVLASSLLPLAACGSSAHSTGARIAPVATDPPVSASPPDAQPASDCERAARALDAPPNQASTNALELVLAGREAALPLPGHDHPVAAVHRYATVQAYLADNVGISDPATRAQVMQRDGFRAGADVELRVGRDDYFVTVLEFASPEAAADFAKYHAHAICEGASDLRPITGLTHAIVYNRLVAGEPPIAKAVFVAGSDEVSLSICPCVNGGEERLALASAWAIAVAHQLGIS